MLCCWVGSRKIDGGVELEQGLQERGRFIPTEDLVVVEQCEEEEGG